MAKFLLVVEGPPGERGRKPRRSVGGGKTLADAERNAAKVFKREPEITELVVEEEKVSTNDRGVETDRYTEVVKALVRPKPTPVTPSPPKVDK